MADQAPELLYHTILTVVDKATNPSRAIRTVYVLGTHSTLQAAKRFANGALVSALCFHPGGFAVLEQADMSASWSHGDGVLVFAKALSGQEFRLTLDTKPNVELLRASPDGGVVLPGGANHLHYVLQTKIDHNHDRGECQAAEIEGSFLRRKDALAAARASLVANKDDFAQYDERENIGLSEEWPYGDDVLVHAVSNFGENYSVAVKIPPDAQQARYSHVNLPKQSVVSADPNVTTTGRGVIV